MQTFVRDNLSAIRALCRKHGVARLELIGSAGAENFDPRGSEVDFVVEFNPGVRKGLGGAYFGLLEDLECLLGRAVDLIERGAIHNPVFRASYEATRVAVYGAA